jgi:ribosomal-protein-alanine N-acetyltransferase
MVTDRLHWVPATVALCAAAAHGCAAVGRALGAVVPESWPPPVFESDDVERVRLQLLADPNTGRWTLHYVLRRAVSDTGSPELVGVAGYAGPPTPDGVVEIGYAIAVEYQRQGFATEVVRALLDGAFADPHVLVVVATTYATLRPSIRVLEKTGFIEVSHASETGLMRFERRADSLV